MLSLIGALALLAGASGAFANEGGHAGWQRAAGNEVANLPSLQRGARNFMSYCSGCHSLKYMRYSRVAEDLKISDELRDQLLVKPGAKFSDYIKTSMPAADAQEWFGKAAAGSVAGRAFARQRLGLQFPHHVLRGSGQPPDRREQPAIAGHRDAARARKRAGRADRRVGQRRAQG